MEDNLRVRNILAKSLGVFWIIDGLLQFQPKMFTVDFVNNVLAPNLVGQPGILRAAITFGISAWNTNPVIANLTAALLQIVIGVLLFFPPTDKKFRTALYLSIAWGLIVWIFGEGGGLLFTGSASFFTGAPGSVLIYALLALLLLVPKKIGTSSYPKIAGWIMVACSLLQVRPISLFVLTLAVGLMLIIKPSRVAGVVAFIFLFGVWWLGQDFGQLSTLIVGTTTDPNTAPVLALMLIPIFLAGRKYSARL